MTMPPPPPGSHNTNPTEAYFEPNTSSSNNPYAQGGTPHLATALIPHSPQIMSPTSTGGTVVVSAMTPHPVMAVHAAPPGINGVPVMNGGLLRAPAGRTHNVNTSKSNSGGSGGTLHGLHTQSPLLQSPPPGHTHLPSASPYGHGVGVGGGGLLQHVGGVSHHQTQYVYASAATAVGTVGSPHFVYKFHQVNPGAGRAYST